MLSFIDADALPENAILTDDPMRSRMLAAHYLDNAVPLHGKRGMVAFSGSYKGAKIAVLSCGFGTAAAESYLCEMARLGAKTVVYTGECVSLTGAYPLRQVIIAEGSDKGMIQRAQHSADSFELPPFTLCGVVTHDLYYINGFDGEAPNGILDFASDAVFCCARTLGLTALSLLTVSENAATGERVEDHERQSRFHNASRLCFETLALENAKL